MALDKKAYSRFGASLFYVQDTAYGTAAADSSSLRRLRLKSNEVANFEENQFVDDQHQNQGLTIHDIGDHYETTAGQLQKFSIPEFTPSGS
jgi:hypothetical protein